MNIKILKEKIKNNECNNIFKELYKDEDISIRRYLNIIEGFENVFGEERDVNVFSAPGRTEIIGNHTDHQCGLAIGASINLDIVGIASFNNSNVIRVKSEGYDGIDEINIYELEVNIDEYNTSKALIRGVLKKFSELNCEIKGFDLYTSSNVLKGSGLSSSAAFEVLIATVFNHLFCNGKVNEVEIAKIGKFAENVYFNKPCGMLDQTAASVGGFVYMDFVDKDDVKISKNEFDLTKYGYSLCIVDTGGNHADLTNEYSYVSGEIKKVCSCFNKETLREVDETEFVNNLNIVREKAGDRGVLRAFHVFDENKRVKAFKEALEKEDFNEILRLVKESGNSSYKYLQNVFAASNVKEQGLSLALIVSERILKGEGAVRVHGGGFAGTIQAYVPKKLKEEYKTGMEKVFGKGKCYDLFIRQVGGIKVI